MNNVLLLGTLLSIPIGIITSLLTPLVLGFFQNINQKARTKSKYIAQKEYEMITSFHINKQELLMFFLNIIIKTTFVSAIITVISYFFIITPQVIFPIMVNNDSFFIDTRILQMMTVIGHFVLLIGSILIVNLCRTAFNVWGKVKNYDNYTRILKEKNIIEVAEK